jgi:hypothetical protein
MPLNKAANYYTNKSETSSIDEKTFKLIFWDKNAYTSKLMDKGVCLLQN